MAPLPVMGVVPGALQGADRLRSWPEDGRPPTEVTAWLDRVFL